MKQLSIAIDGPAGAGKSTVAKGVARKLSFIYVDTGAMYRAIGFFIKKQNIDPKEARKVAEACLSAEVSISYYEGEQQVLLNGENVTESIRTEEIGIITSQVSAYQAVREKLVELQQKLAYNENVVMDGRDIGTKVLPDANLKIYLTATSAERAKRRYLEILGKGVQADIDKIEEDIIDRDYQDMHRENSPLTKAEDAILVDCSDMTPEDVIDHICLLYRNTTKFR